MTLIHVAICHTHQDIRKRNWIKSVVRKTVALLAHCSVQVLVSTPCYVYSCRFPSKMWSVLQHGHRNTINPLWVRAREMMVEARWNKPRQTLKMKHLISGKCPLQLASRGTCQPPEALQGSCFLMTAFNLSCWDFNSVFCLSVCLLPTHLPTCNAKYQRYNLVHPCHLLSDLFFYFPTVCQ